MKCNRVKMHCKEDQAKIDALCKLLENRVFDKPFRVGERVEILRKDIFERPKNKKHWYGRIISINGGYHYVRPMRCKWETELYDVEIAHA